MQSLHSVTRLIVRALKNIFESRSTNILQVIRPIFAQSLANAAIFQRVATLLLLSLIWFCLKLASDSHPLRSSQGIFIAYFKIIRTYATNKYQCRWDTRSHANILLFHRLFLSCGFHSTLLNLKQWINDMVECHRITVPQVKYTYGSNGGDDQPFCFLFEFIACTHGFTVRSCCYLSIWTTRWNKLMQLNFTAYSQ